MLAKSQVRKILYSFNGQRTCCTKWSLQCLCQSHESGPGEIGEDIWLCRSWLWTLASQPFLLHVPRTHTSAIGKFLYLPQFFLEYIVVQCTGSLQCFCNYTSMGEFLSRRNLLGWRKAKGGCIPSSFRISLCTAFFWLWDGGLFRELQSPFMHTTSRCHCFTSVFSELVKAAPSSCSSLCWATSPKIPLPAEEMLLLALVGFNQL